MSQLQIWQIIFISLQFDPQTFFFLSVSLFLYAQCSIQRYRTREIMFIFFIVFMGKSEVWLSVHIKIRSDGCAKKNFVSQIFSFNELCCLFCCPPFPSRIAAKLAFLPPEPTYSLVANEESKTKFQLQLNEKAEWPYSERDKDTIESFYTRTARGNRIACIFVKCCTNARYTILFSHGMVYFKTSFLALTYLIQLLS